MDLTFSSYLFLILASFFAGLVDSIAGGGGLITVPSFLAVGIPPHLALGTNKLQSTFGALTASYHYTKSGLVKPLTIWKGVLWTFVGASIGTIIIQIISSDILKYIIPFMLVIIFVYTLVSPNAGLIDRQARLSTKIFYLIFGLTLGFYDGFFGPGTGSFWALAIVFFLGMNLKTATAHTKILNCVSNLASLIFFLIGGNVLISLGCITGLAQIVGATIGSHLVIRKGARFVRIVFLCVVGATIAKLLWNLWAQGSLN